VTRVAGNGAARDPVSELWDTAAAHMLSRAYELRGAWFSTIIKDPTPRQASMFAAIGIDVDGRDNAATMSGKRMNCRTRWCRAFVRAVYYANDDRHGGPGRAIEIEVGARKPAVGRTPAGRAVRVRVRRSGSVALKAVQRKADDDRIWSDEGQPAGRFSDISGRDW
jgi:hypothetical protein